MLLAVDTLERMGLRCAYHMSNMYAPTLTLFVDFYPAERNSQDRKAALTAAGAAYRSRRT